MRAEHRGRNIRRVLFILLAAVFAFSAYRLGSGWYRTSREDHAFDVMQRQVQQKESETPAGQSPYASLKDANADFFGWLKIDDTAIDYPVMYTPAEPEKYLHRAFDGSDSFSGTPFLSDGMTGNNSIVYAHNMKNGTMFADLLQYADPYFGAAHAQFAFNTMDEQGTYQVLYAFYSRVYRQNEVGVFRYYDMVGTLDQSKFAEYLAQCRAAALYDLGETAVFGDTLLTLSTCSYNTADERFVVVAKKIS